MVRSSLIAMFVQRPSLKSRPPPQPRILSEDDGHVAAMCGPLFVVVWKRAITVPAVSSLGMAMREAARAAPGGRVGTFSVVERGYALPSATERQEMVAAIRLNPIAFVVVVYEESGFVAAAIRGILAGASLIGGSAMPVHFSSSVADGAQWVETSQSGFGSSQELQTWIENLRHGKR